MQPVLFCIFLAIAVALLGWGISRVWLSSDRAEHRRLQQRLSSQRSVAGDSAEKTLLLLQENQNGLSAVLAQKSLFQNLARKLQATQSSSTLVRFFGLTVGFAAAAALGAMMLSNSVLITVVALLLGGSMPYMMLSHKYNKRQKTFIEQLPEALDFMSRILRAGHSLSTGLQMMGTEQPDPLASEFRRCYDQHSLGSPLEDCLKEMAQRVDCKDFSFFVTAVLIQRQTGGDLSQVLTNISAIIRGRLRLQSYVKAKTAEGRFTGYILVCFPVIMFLIAYTLNPLYAGALIHTTTGLKLMGVAGVMEVLGLICIQKLTTVKV
jgi:tight adherence protein B